MRPVLAASGFGLARFAFGSAWLGEVFQQARVAQVVLTLVRIFHNEIVDQTGSYLDDPDEPEIAPEAPRQGSAVQQPARADQGPANQGNDDPFVHILVHE